MYLGKQDFKAHQPYLDRLTLNISMLGKNYSRGNRWEQREKQEAHGPRVAHLSDIATEDMQMLCNIFPILSSQLMKRSSFKQFFILKKKIYGMPVNWSRSFEQTLNGSQLGFTIGTILAIFDLRVTPMLPTKFRVNWPFSSGEEAKNRFSRWLPWRSSWISDYKSSQCLLPSLESIGLSVQEKKLNIDFQDGGHGGHLGFLIRTILAIFDLQVNLMLPTKFQVKWLLSLGEAAKNRFSR